MLQWCWTIWRQRLCINVCPLSLSPYLLDSFLIIPLCWFEQNDGTNTESNEWSDQTRTSGWFEHFTHRILDESDTGRKVCFILCLFAYFVFYGITQSGCSNQCYLPCNRSEFHSTNTEFDHINPHRTVWYFVSRLIWLIFGLGISIWKKAIWRQRATDIAVIVCWDQFLCDEGNAICSGLRICFAFFLCVWFAFCKHIERLDLMNACLFLHDQKLLLSMQY